MPKLPTAVREAVDIVSEAAQGWSDDNAPSMGAALAYYTLFSIAPLLLIVISVAGLVFGEQAARGEVMAQLSDLLGTQGAMAVEDLLKRVNRPDEGGWAAAIGTVVLLVGATSVFAELQNSLNDGGREIVSRLKILAKLDIAERRRPQDGSFRVRIERNGEQFGVDLRVSVIPSVYGESVVLRILDRTRSPGTIDALGFPRPM